MIEVFALAASALALLIAIVSVALALYFSPTATLNQRVTTTENDLTELADRVHHWMRRDSVRRVREKLPSEAADIRPPSSHPKAALFARAREVLRKAGPE